MEFLLIFILSPEKQRPVWRGEDGSKRWMKQLQVVTISCHLCKFIVPV